MMNYVQDILTLLYNDEHPDGPTSFDLGHTKVPFNNNFISLTKFEIILLLFKSYSSFQKINVFEICKNEIFYCQYYYKY